VLRTIKRNKTVAESRIATIRSAYLMSFGFTERFGLSIEMIGVDFVVEKTPCAVVNKC